MNISLDIKEDVIENKLNILSRFIINITLFFLTFSIVWIIQTFNENKLDIITPYFINITVFIILFIIFIILHTHEHKCFC